jgi:hypothetical protein
MYGVNSPNLVTLVAACFVKTAEPFCGDADATYLPGLPDGLFSYKKLNLVYFRAPWNIIYFFILWPYIIIVAHLIYLWPSGKVCIDYE